MIIRRGSFGALCFLSLGVSGYALVAYGLLPVGATVPSDMRASFRAQSALLYSHVFASVVALALGPLQFWSRLRSTNLSLHRWLGRLYLGVGVLIGGVSGVFVALSAYGGFIARTGFAVLAILWLYTGCRAYQTIRSGQVGAHRRWMIRNFSLTFAAVTLRAIVPVFMVAGLRFEFAYQAAAWVSWLLNFVVAELLFNRSPDRGV